MAFGHPGTGELAGAPERVGASVNEAGDELGGGGDVVNELCGLSGEGKEFVTSTGAHGGQQLGADLGGIDAGGSDSSRSMSAVRRARGAKGTPVCGKVKGGITLSA